MLPEHQNVPHALGPVDLVVLARRINEREEVIEALRKRTLDEAAQAVAEAMLQGADLLKAKASMKHGQWLPWLKVQCPKTARQAQKYMRLAANPKLAEEFIDAGSIRRALALLEERASAGSGKEAKQWPPGLECVGKVSKLRSFVARHPIGDWPREWREKFTEELGPIASETVCEECKAGRFTPSCHGR